MERIPYYQVLHVFSLLVLTVQTFMAFGSPDPANRKRTMMITGVAALLMLGSGFGLLALKKIPFTTGWVLVKFVCWIGFSALAGIAYRRADLRGGLSLIGFALLLTALVMVFFRPF
jgi:uncharacterized membrane protein SirB2